MKLNVGDSVTHRLVKECMTVMYDKGFLPNGKQVVTCKWFGADGRWKKNLFLAESLIKIK